MAALAAERMSPITTLLSDSTPALKQDFDATAAVSKCSVAGDADHAAEQIQLELLGTGIHQR